MTNVQYFWGARVEAREIFTMTHSQCLYTALDSTLLKSAAYSTDETLQLEFRTGAAYRFFGVPSTRHFSESHRRHIQRRLLQSEHQKQLSLPARRLTLPFPPPLRPDFPKIL
jgi:hypothetical protein